MLVEGGLGDRRLGDQTVDADDADALVVEEAVGGGEHAGAGAGSGLIGAGTARETLDGRLGESTVTAWLLGTYRLRAAWGTRAPDLSMMSDQPPQTTSRGTDRLR
nr:hypothetical protein GCM10025699_57420 [Microbacterium flavescens]